MPNKPKVTTNIQDLPPEVLPLIRLHLNGPRSNGNQRGMTANESSVFTGLLYYILERPIANSIVSVSISTYTYFDSDLQDHLRLISKLPRLEMLKIGPQSLRSALKSNLRFRTLKALMMDTVSFVAPPSLLRDRRQIFPKLATFFIESNNFVHWMTKKMGYMPNCIEKDNLHHVEQYWTDFIEDNGSSKPNYTKEVYEIFYRNEERLTLLWADSRKVCRTIKVSNVPLSILMPIVNSNTSHQ
ncbi:hypothetical protein WALSEDRAFT_57983, partial [Wallemia mellicola CBS 633.66]